MVAEAMRLLQEEAELQEIVRLVGIDALSVRDRWILESAKSIREDYLHQNAFHDIDTYTSVNKQYRMLKTIMMFHSEGIKALDAGAFLSEITNLPVKESIARAKLILENNLDAFDSIEKDIKHQMSSIVSNGGV